MITINKRSSLPKRVDKSTPRKGVFAPASVINYYNKHDATSLTVDSIVVIYNRNMFTQGILKAEVSLYR